MAMMRMKLLRKLRSERGSLMLETVIALAITLPILLTLFDGLRWLYSNSMVVYAGESAIRYAEVHGADAGMTNCSGPGCVDSGGQNIIQVVDQNLRSGLAGLAVPSSVETSVSWESLTSGSSASSPTPGTTVLVTMIVPFNSWFLPTSMTTRTFHFRGQIEY
jgi:hypothetical protein